MTIDWFRWRHADKVPLHTAVALACDIDPDVIESRLSGNAHSLDLFLIDLSFFERFLSFASECLPQEITLPEFAKWHDETGIGKLPDEFPRITGNCVSGIPITPTSDIEIELPVSEDYMRLGDALETVPMLIAFALFPRGGEMVRGAKRIENGVEIIKQSQGPDDTEIKKLIESGEWTPITMDMEIYQRTMRNEVAQEWREKLESAAKAGRLAIIDSLSRLPATGKNPENLIPIHALKDWCASIGVTIKAESKSAAEQQVNGNHRELEQPKVVINRLKLNDQRLSILRQILDEQFPDYANEKLDIAPIEMWMLCRNKEPNLFQPQTPDAQGEYQTVKQFFGFARRNGVPIYFKKGR